MLRVLITGSDGFIGKNLRVQLESHPKFEVSTHCRKDSLDSLKVKLGSAAFIVHLAGVNRPSDVSEFERVNSGLTEFIAECLASQEQPSAVIFASSKQAILDNPYGNSKRNAEDILHRLAPEKTATKTYRLPGVFGKWCRPNYNSVVATFCHNVAHGIPLTISDAQATIELVYIDDLIDSVISDLESGIEGHGFGEIQPSYHLTLSELSSKLLGFKEQRAALRLPDVGCEITKKLYATYLSYLPRDEFSYSLEERRDNRGKLFEILKSDSAGQIFMSTTKPGVTRGNHYHHTKVEKFCVITGQATIRFRKIDEQESFEYRVSGDNVVVVDIPPGYTHSIQNTGDTDAIVLFWASEIFQPESPDTFYLDVLLNEQT